jgi:tetratricopeptide (TPR) repeat protein
LGSAAMGDLEFSLADRAFQRAMELAPTDAALLSYIGTQYSQFRRLDQALACVKRAVALDPSATSARLTMVSWLERSRRLDEAWECVQAYLTQHPKDGQALYLSAFLLHRKGLSGEAETALRDLLKSGSSLPLPVKSNANYLLGTVLDGCGQYAEALRCLGEAKSLRGQSTNTAELELTYEKVDQTRRKALAELTPKTLERWREEASDTPCPHPLALLCSAPRSGTTLLEQILGAHPEIPVFDESLAFQKEVLDKILAPQQDRLVTLQSLSDLPAAGRAQMIRCYFKSLLREMEDDPGDKLLLDKSPSRTAWLHVWLRLFPQSKVIIALRDPRDVIISCYFQNIPLSWNTVGFLSLEGTARFYSTCMDAWLRMRELGGFEWIETRYEDVVDDLEGEGRRVTNFLGLPWQETQSNYYDAARRRHIYSPTYNDVTKPVYKRSVGRWEHYAEALAPLQEGLEKYCRAFGYK